MQAQKKKIAIIGTNGLPANYGGFETLTDYLTRQKSKDFDFLVFCTKTAKEKRIKTCNGAVLKYLPFNANGGQSIIYDIVSIIKTWFKYDTLVILGTPGCIIIPFLKIFKKTNTVINFGGLEWKRDKWHVSVRKYLKFTESIAIKNASHIVADNQYFCGYIEEEYGKMSELIEYGGDHTSPLSITSALEQKYPFLQNSYDVSVSRAQPDNNLHLLLAAYSKLPERNLVLVSNYNKFEYGRQLKEKYSGFPNLFLQDAVYDLNELDVIRSNARLYIHSHSFCGTAPSLVEAMSLGLPIIAFDVLTNHKTTEEKALFFDSSSSLVGILGNLNSQKELELGASMKEIANRRYTWKRISNKYAELF